MYVDDSNVYYNDKVDSYTMEDKYFKCALRVERFDEIVSLLPYKLKEIIKNVCKTRIHNFTENTEFIFSATFLKALLSKFNLPDDILSIIRTNIQPKVMFQHDKYVECLDMNEYNIKLNEITRKYVKNKKRMKNFTEYGTKTTVNMINLSCESNTDHIFVELEEG